MKFTLGDNLYCTNKVITRLKYVEP